MVEFNRIEYKSTSFQFMENISKIHCCAQEWRYLKNIQNIA